MNRLTFGVYAYTLAALLAFAAPGFAQYKPQHVPDPATGETFHFEVAAGFWGPSADIHASSQALGITGTDIDFKQDLGLEDKRFPEFQIVGRLTRSQKLRFEYIPIQYHSIAVLRHEIIFNGQKYTVGLPVNSTLDWKAFRFGYEWDFVVRDRLFAGLIIDAKYTDVQVSLASPIDAEYAHAKAPIPAIGGIVRYYFVPNISVTGELTGIKIPSTDSYNGHFADINIYGTLNFTNNIGVQGGIRRFDVGYLVKSDSGSLALGGIWFGIVARY